MPIADLETLNPPTAAQRAHSGRGKNGSPKRYVFIVDNYIGHLYGTLGLAQRLRDAGNHVVYFVGSEAAQVIRKFGLDAVENDWLENKSKQRSVLRGLLNRKSVESERVKRLSKIDDAIASFVRSQKPDLAVFDPFLLKYFPLFDKYGTKAVSISTKPLLTRSSLTPPYTSGVIPTDSRLGRMRVDLAWMRQKLSYFLYCLQEAACQLVYADSRWLNEAVIELFAGKTYKRQDRHVRFDMRYEGMPELVLQAREFDFPRTATEQGSAIFIGPCIRRLPNTSDAEAFLPDGDGPLVLCSMGTVRRKAQAHIVPFYLKVIQALAGSSYRLIVAAGSNDEMEAIQRECRHKANVRICAWIPQQQLLSMCSLLVTHGGGGSLKEAFSQGVPVLVFPMRADQPGCGARVEYHRLGRMGSLKKATSTNIRRLVDEVIHNEGYKNNCIRLAQAYRRYDDESVAVKALALLAAGDCELRKFDGGAVECK
ncbi:glycosyltransferase [Agrobacterium vitis]|nr:glycosyltransferase [Agrobacterium vitis]